MLTYTADSSGVASWTESIRSSTNKRCVVYPSLWGGIRVICGLYFNLEVSAMRRIRNKSTYNTTVSRLSTTCSIRSSSISRYAPQLGHFTSMVHWILRGIAAQLNNFQRKACSEVWCSSFYREQHYENRLWRWSQISFSGMERGEFLFLSRILG